LTSRSRSPTRGSRQTSRSRSPRRAAPPPRVRSPQAQVAAASRAGPRYTPFPLFDRSELSALFLLLVPLLSCSSLVGAAVEEDGPQASAEDGWTEEPPPPLPPLSPGEPETAATSASQPPNFQPGMEDFEQALQESGTWVNDADLGRVWAPAP